MRVRDTVISLRLGFEKCQSQPHILKLFKVSVEEFIQWNKNFNQYLHTQSKFVKQFLNSKRKYH